MTVIIFLSVHRYKVGKIIDLIQMADKGLE